MIDSLDKRILNLLEVDARQSKSALARRLGVNKTLVAYRINRLHKREIIQGYRYLTDQEKLGKVSYGILIRFQDARLDEQEAIVRKLKAAKTFDWITLTTGAWDAMAVVVAGDFFAFNDRLNDMLKQYGRYVREYRFYIDYAGSISGHDYLYETPYPPPVAYEQSRDGHLVVNDLDRQIIEHLDRDAIVSFMRLATRLNRTFDTIQTHYRSLSDKGILLKAVPIINHELLGSTNTLCLYELKPHAERIAALSAFCLGHPRIIRQAKCLGHFNLILNIHSTNSRQLKEIIGSIDKQYSDIVISYDLVNTIDLV